MEKLSRRQFLKSVPLAAATALGLTMISAENVDAQEQPISDEEREAKTLFQEVQETSADTGRINPVYLSENFAVGVEGLTSENAIFPIIISAFDYWGGIIDVADPGHKQQLIPLFVDWINKTNLPVAKLYTEDSEVFPLPDHSIHFKASDVTTPLLSYQYDSDGNFILNGDGVNYSEYNEYPDFRVAYAENESLNLNGEMDPYSIKANFIIQSVFNGKDHSSSRIITADGIPILSGLGEAFRPPSIQAHNLAVSTTLEHSLGSSFGLYSLVGDVNPLTMERLSMPDYVEERYSINKVLRSQKKDPQELGILYFPFDMDRNNTLQSIQDCVEGKDIETLNLIFVLPTSDQKGEMQKMFGGWQDCIIPVTAMTTKDGKLNVSTERGLISRENAKGRLFAWPDKTPSVFPSGNLRKKKDGSVELGLEFKAGTKTGVSNSALQFVTALGGISEILKKKGIRPSPSTVQKAAFDLSPIQSFDYNGGVYDVRQMDLYKLAHFAGINDKMFLSEIKK